MDIQQAIEAPRIRHDSSLEIFYENRFGEGFLAPLLESGYSVRNMGPWSRVMGGQMPFIVPRKC